MQYRKRPIVVDAFQWRFNTPPSKWPSWLPDAIVGDPGSPEPRIETPEGIMTVRDRDWIIQGVKGEVYPCKPDIFEMTYEPVSE